MCGVTNHSIRTRIGFVSNNERGTIACTSTADDAFSQWWVNFRREVEATIDCYNCVGPPKAPFNSLAAEETLFVSRYIDRVDRGVVWGQWPSTNPSYVRRFNKISGTTTRRATPTMKLINALPEFSRELAEGLIAEGRNDLANSIYTIEIIDRCLCEVPGCIAFHAVPKATAPKWPDECERIVPCVRGVTCVLFVDHSVVWIEALGRVEEKARLEQLEALAQREGELGEQ